MERSSQKSVRAEIIDFLAWACHVFIHDEDANETDLDHVIVLSESHLKRMLTAYF